MKWKKMGGVNYFIKIPRKLERSTDEKFQKAMNNFKNNDRNSTKTAQKQQKSSEITRSCQIELIAAYP
jgi:hypothetical protein